jgi:hypothetical protein
LRYALCFLLVLVSIAEWSWAVSVDVAKPFLSLFLAVLPLTAGCAALFGRSGGMISALATGLIGWYVILPPRLSFELADYAEGQNLLLTLLCAVLASLAVGTSR